MTLNAALSNPAVWGLAGAAFAAIAGFFGIQWKTNHEELSAQKREAIAVSAATKAAEITAKITSEATNLASLQTQVANLVMEIRELKISHAAEIKELRDAYNQLNKDFDAELRERRSWEKTAEKNQMLAEKYQELVKSNEAKITELQAKITLIQNERLQASLKSDKTISEQASDIVERCALAARQEAKIAALREQILTLNTENELLREFAPAPIGSGERYYGEKKV